MPWVVVPFVVMTVMSAPFAALTIAVSALAMSVPLGLRSRMRSWGDDKTSPPRDRGSISPSGHVRERGAIRRVHPPTERRVIAAE
jgi:hypothetical protein